MDPRGGSGGALFDPCAPALLTTMDSLKSFLGVVGLIVDALCLFFVGTLLVTFFQPNGGDALFLLMFASPFLGGIMLVATTIAVLCFRSVRKKEQPPGEAASLTPGDSHTEQPCTSGELPLSGEEVLVYGRCVVCNTAALDTSVRCRSCYNKRIRLYDLPRMESIPTLPQRK